VSLTRGAAALLSSNAGAQPHLTRHVGEHSARERLTVEHDVDNLCATRGVGHGFWRGGGWVHARAGNQLRGWRACSVICDTGGGVGAVAVVRTLAAPFGYVLVDIFSDAELRGGDAEEAGAGAPCRT
jgi:hypothetical protein